MRQVVVDAPAKINLGLEVIRRRADGYHDIRSVMAMLQLSDRLLVLRTIVRTMTMLTELPRKQPDPQSALAVSGGSATLGAPWVAYRKAHTGSSRVRRGRVPTPPQPCSPPISSRMARFPGRGSTIWHRNLGVTCRSFSVRR
jgi:hypothetical protein